MFDYDFTSTYTKQVLEALLTLSHNKNVCLHEYNTKLLSPVRRLPPQELSSIMEDLTSLQKKTNIDESPVRKWIISFAKVYLDINASPHLLLTRLLELQEELRLMNLHRTKLSALLHNNIALKYHDLQKPNEAIQEYTKAIDIDPTYSLAFYNRAITERSLEMLEDALRDYTKAHELDPTDSDALNNRGSIYFHQNKFDLAAQDFSKSIELDTTSPFPYFNRALCFSEIGMYVLEARDLRKANQNNQQMYSDRLKDVLSFLLAESREDLLLFNWD